MTRLALSLVALLAALHLEACNLGVPVPTACVTPDAGEPITTPDGGVTEPTPDAGSPKVELTYGHACAAAVDFYDLAHGDIAPPAPPTRSFVASGLALDDDLGRFKPVLVVEGCRYVSTVWYGPGAFENAPGGWTYDASDEDCANIPTVTYGSVAFGTRPEGSPVTTITPSWFSGQYPYDGGEHRFTAYTDGEIICVPVVF